MTYREQIESEEWASFSRRVKKRDGFACTRCGSTDNIQAHHKLYNRDGYLWDVPLDWMETLCESCHKEYHEALKTLRLLPCGQFLDLLNRNDAGIESIDISTERFLRLENEQLKKLIEQFEIQSASSNPNCIEYWIDQ